MTLFSEDTCINSHFFVYSLLSSSLDFILGFVFCFSFVFYRISLPVSYCADLELYVHQLVHPLALCSLLFHFTNIAYKLTGVDDTEFLSVRFSEPQRICNKLWPPQEKEILWTEFQMNQKCHVTTWITVLYTRQNLGTILCDLNLRGAAAVCKSECSWTSL